MSTINVILPVIKHVDYDKNFHFQYHIKKVLACCLHHNLVKAYSDSGSSLTRDAWAELKCKYNPMSKYMYIV